MGIGPYRDLFLKNSAPLVLGKMKNIFAGERNSFFMSNMASAPTFKVVSLADDNNSASGYDSKEMKIMGLLSIIFLIGVSIFCNRRRSTVEEGNRASRQAGAHKNGKGLERSVIESFPVFSYNLVKGLKAQAMGSECAVCLSDFGDEEMVRLLPKCSHAFHPECIDIWLCSNTTCPICRVSLTPAEDSIPTAKAEPRTTPEQITIVVDNGNNEAPETSNDSTEHSLVMVQPTEWCIATPRGLTPGLHRSCSFTANHHFRAPSTSNVRPVSSKTGCSVDDVGRRSKSKRWGSISMKSGSFFRSFTEQRSHNGRVSRTSSLVMVGEGEMKRGEGTEMGSTSSGHGIQFREKSSVLSSEKVKGILRYKSF